MKNLFLALGMFAIQTVCVGQCLEVSIGIIIDTTASPCNGPITLDAKYPDATYNWSTGEETQKIRVTTTDTFFVEVNRNGCIGSDTVTVTFADPPYVELGNDPEEQCGGCVLLNAGSDGSSYLWSNGSTESTLTFCEEGSHKIWVDVFSESGCKSSDTINVTINPGIPFDLGKDTAQCGGSVLLQAPEGYSYKWSTNETTQTISVNTSNTYHVEITDAEGCVGIDSIDVQINPLPNIELGSDPSPICGGCIQLTGGNADNSYEWSTGETTETIKFCKTGENKIFVNATDSNGCIASDSITLTISEGPAVDLGNDIEQCGGTVSLRSNIQGASYTWSNGESSSETEIISSGKYWLEITDNDGCKGSDTVNVSIKPVPSVDLGPDPEERCGGCVSLNGNQSDPSMSYLWSTREYSSSIRYCEEGENKVWLRITNSEGCSTADTINVNIRPGYTVNLGKDTIQCGGEIILNAGYPDSESLWNTGETTKSISVNESGIYQVQVFAIPGCSATDTISGSIKVTFAPELNSPLTVNDISGNCPERIIQVEEVPGADSYTWSVPADWEILKGQNTAVLTVLPPGPESSGNVTVIAENSYGCKSPAKAAFVSTPEMGLSIPNAFTPNEDGINDQFVIKNIKYYPENEFTVLNRWGNEVYKKQSYDDSWNGSELNEGTYFYRLNYTECHEQKNISGDITILR